MLSRYATIDRREQWSGLLNQHLGQVMSELGVGSFDASTRVGALDLRETKDAYILIADIPGFESKDVLISIEGRKLNIQTQRREKVDPTDGKLLFKERRLRALNRSVILPKTVNEADIHASVGEGILTVTLPKKANETPRQIQVHSSMKDT